MRHDCRLWTQASLKEAAREWSVLIALAVATFLLLLFIGQVSKPASYVIGAVMFFAVCARLIILNRRI